MSYTPELHAAVDFLRTLRQGDSVVVSQPGHPDLKMTVSRTAHLVDGAHGPYESTRVTVTTDKGYAFSVSAESMVERVTTNNHPRSRVPSWMRTNIRRVES